jgi:hypothetical protein
VKKLIFTAYLFFLIFTHAAQAQNTQDVIANLKNQMGENGWAQCSVANLDMVLITRKDDINYTVLQVMMSSYELVKQRFIADGVPAAHLGNLLQQAAKRPFDESIWNKCVDQWYKSAPPKIPN